MNSRTDDLPTLQAQLAEKTELVAALTAQLEKTVTQLDRLRRSGADRPGSSSSGLSSSVSSLQSELSEKLGTAIDDWQEFQPAERIVRIEDGIERILDLLESQRKMPPTAAEQKPSPGVNDDFWSAAKARILAEHPPSPESSDSHPFPADPQPEEIHSPEIPPASTADEEDSTFAEIGNSPDAPTPVTEASSQEDLIAGVKSRDTYIQYLTSRLRMAESRKYLPVKWELLEAAPEKFRSRLESLETLLQDHLRQAEVAHSLERAMLARERAKLAQIKQNLESQIKRMVPASAPEVKVPSKEPPVESKTDPEGRWKRIFTR